MVDLLGRIMGVARLLLIIGHNYNISLRYLVIFELHSFGFKAGRPASGEKIPFVYPTDGTSR